MATNESVLDRVKDRATAYSRLGFAWGCIFFVLVGVSVVASGAVAAYSALWKDHSPYTLATVSFLAAVSSGLLSITDAKKNFDLYWDAWKYINAAITEQISGVINDQQLIEAMRVADSYLQASRPPYQPSPPTNVPSARPLTAEGVPNQPLRQPGTVELSPRTSQTLNSKERDLAMKKFDRVKQYLEEAVNGDTIGAHGNFWRSLDLEQFKTFAVPVKGHWPLLVVGDGANSNLIKALQGVAPFGKDVGVSGATLNRMPDPDAGYNKMPDDRIKYIKDWIDAGCLDEEETPPT